MNRFNAAYWQHLRAEVKKEWHAQYPTWQAFVWKVINVKDYDRHDWIGAGIGFVVGYVICKLVSII